MTELFRIWKELIDDISGIHGAIQGKSANSGTPMGLYEQEAANSAINTIDFMQTIGEQKQSRDLKSVKLIKQYFTEDQFIATAGKAYSPEAKKFKADRVAMYDYDVVVSHSFDAPVFRQAMEQQLTEFVMKGILPFEAYLEVTTMPGAQKILDTITKAKEQAQNGQAPQSGIPPEVQQAADQGDPKARAMIEQAIKSTQH